VSLYQRLLARDEDESEEIVTQQSEKLSAVELCDRVLLPTIAHARRELVAGQLSSEEYEVVLGGVRSLAEQQDIAAAASADRRAVASDEDRSARAVLKVLACPAQDGADSLALELFQQVLDPAKYQVELVSSKRLVSEVLEQVAAHQPAVVCIASLPAGGLAHTRHLCKRLRARFSGQKILVGRWGTHGPIENREQWDVCGADEVGATVAETISQLDQIAQFLRPAKGESGVGAPHFPARDAADVSAGQPVSS
jgi:hypothetical protein